MEFKNIQICFPPHIVIYLALMTRPGINRVGKTEIFEENNTTIHSHEVDVSR